MKRDERIEKEIREHWFPNHNAEYVDLGQIKILNWCQPGTSTYYCRYVFDGVYLYISGDVGEAVFSMSDLTDVHYFNSINVDYFHRKLKAFCEDTYVFDSDQAKKRLTEWVKELTENDIQYNAESMELLFEAADACNSVREWADYINSDEYNEFVSELDPDYWEWLYKIGNAIPWRIYGYLIGLQMASKQLKNKE